MSKVAIVDYGVGNLFSVNQACQAAGIDAVITSNPADLRDAQGIILPGVGAFGFAMRRLTELGLRDALMQGARAGKPVMGICLGFQLLFESSDEMGSTEGLGLVPGRVLSLRHAADQAGVSLRIPNVAWLPVHATMQPQHAQSNAGAWDGTLLQGLPQGVQMYFVHSFYAQPAHAAHALASTHVSGVTYCCATARENVFGCQFHPEKSSGHGLHIYRNLAQRLKAT